MPDPSAQAASQLRNIEESTGFTVADFVDDMTRAGLEKHGKMVAYLKSEHGMTHGNANLIAHLVRERMAGGPPAATDLLEAQYTGAKAGLLPIYEELAAIAESLGDDVEKVVQKTGVSFRRARQFALVQVPSSKRVQLGLNLDETPSSDRIVEMSGMCTHKVDVTSVDEVDDTVAGWIRRAYDRAV